MIISRRKYFRQKNSIRMNGIFTTVSPGSPYPSTYLNMPPDMDDWDCDTWKIYYQRNKQLMGQPAAVSFVDIEVNRVGAFADVGLCKYNCEFVDYMRKEGFSMDSFISDVFCSTTGAVTTTLETGETLTKLILPVSILAGLFFANEYSKKSK